MTAIITTHCKLGVVDANGNVTMISIQSTGDDVTIIPNSIVSATTVQALVDSLKSSAFIANFMGINDSSTDGVNVTYSAKMINTKLTGLRSDVDEMMSDINRFLPFPLAIQGSQYGYKKLSGEFTAFKSQADIDSAVAAAKVGTAQQGQVLTGYTFTNSSTSGLSGSMPNNGAVNASLNTGTTSYTVPAGYHNGSGKVSISTQTKSVTPTTSSQTVSPDSGKVLSSVTVGTQAHSGSYKPTTNSSASDMGTTHNYRYVDTTTVYQLGYNVGNNEGYSRGQSDGRIYGINEVLSQSTAVPNLIPCIRIISDYYTFHSKFQLKIVSGYCGNKLRPGLGDSGSSGRPGKYDSNFDIIAESYGYVDGNHAYDGFTDPGVTFGSPYADFCFYNVGDTRYCVLYIGYKYY